MSLCVLGGEEMGTFSVAADGASGVCDKCVAICIS